jgi:D-glycero-D-manno-heptose 1,7-bisphosphate phosphatase
MILRARKEYDLDLNASILVGDKDSGIVAGIAAGVGSNILVSSSTDTVKSASVSYTFTSVRSVLSWFASQM